MEGEGREEDDIPPSTPPPPKDLPPFSPKLGNMDPSNRLWPSKGTTPTAENFYLEGVVVDVAEMIFPFPYLYLDNFST